MKMVSDLRKRTISAVIMLAVVGSALWLGGWPWIALVALVALGVLWEWSALVRAITGTAPGRGVWIVAGIGYIGLAAYQLAMLRQQFPGLFPLLEIVLGVIATDIGAYAVGRTIGGPKVAPRISPSKTWSGLMGGMVAAALVLLALSWFEIRNSFSMEGGCATAGTCRTFAQSVVPVGLSGMLLALVAQAGDFFESWMKRRAGVKDSGNLIPGHGGLFDRVDGLLAVLFVAAIATLVTSGAG